MYHRLSGGGKGGRLHEEEASVTLGGRIIVLETVPDRKLPMLSQLKNPKRQLPSLPRKGNKSESHYIKTGKEKRDCVSKFKARRRPESWGGKATLVLGKNTKGKNYKKGRKKDPAKPVATLYFRE